MARHRKILERLRWDLLAVMALIIFALVYSAVQSPRFQPSDSPLGTGSKPPDRTEGDILLVLPNAPASKATSFDNLDCSFGWINALGHYFGTFASAPSNSVTPQLLAGHSVVVVPTRVATEISSHLREDLGDFVRQGGLLIVETPTSEWHELTGIAATDEFERARAITTAEALVTDDMEEIPLFGVPLTGGLLQLDDRADGVDEDAEIHWKVDGQPGLVSHDVENGRVYSILFDFACSLTALYQGLPTEGLDFVTPDGDPWLPTARRVASERLLATEIPYAQVLSHALFDGLWEFRPLARLWAYPGDHRGAAMSLHTAQRSPRAAFGYAEYVHSRNGRVAIFGAPDYFTPQYMTRAYELGASVGLLWVLGRERPPLTEGVGIGAFEPWAREVTLPDQKERLQALHSRPDSLSMVRTEAGLWQTDWATTFRAMAAAEFRVDTSFGPSEAAHFGYLFGTAMPFYPLDEHGLPLPVLEFPHVLSGAGLTPHRLKLLFETSKARYHQPLAVHLAAEDMERNPTAQILSAYSQFHDLAVEYGHWLTTTDDYVKFLAARRRSVLTTQWSAADRRLTVSVNLLGIRTSDLDEGAIPGVAIPVRFEGAPIERIEVDDDELNRAELSTSGPGTEVIVELSPGQHVLSVFYEAPPPPSESEPESEEGS